MKKNILRVFSFFTEKRNTKIVVSFLLLLCVFFMKTGYCLDFSVNNQTYQVSDLETLRDYIYFDLKSQNKLYKYMVVKELENEYWGYKYTITNFEEYSSITCTSDTRINMNVSSSLAEQQQKRYKADFTLQYESASVGTQVPVFTRYPTTGSNSNTISAFINTDLSCVRNGNTLEITHNFTYDDIECKYNTTECSSYVPPSTEPEEPSSFPITKTEYYVLLVMLGILIFMLFFKWSFPMKGGKKI